MLVPGRVEQIVIIDDFAEHGLTDIPFKFIEEFTKIFLQHYKARSYRDYMLNIPTSFYIIWKFLGLFMDDATLERVIVSKQNFVDDMLVNIDKGQLE